jgi:integrase
MLTGKTAGLTMKRVDKILRRSELGMHFDGQGLYLVVGGKTNASWQRRYELRGRAHQIGLGSAFTFTLAEARERNREISKLLADGIDPLTEKRARRSAQAAATSMTFKQAAELYIIDNQSTWKHAQHGAQWKSSLARYVYPKIGAIDVRDISRPHILAVLEQKVDGGKFWEVRSVTASRVRNRIELVLSSAAARGYRDADNPADWDDLKHILPAPNKLARVEHHPAMPYADLPALMAKLSEVEGIAAQALRFLVLTAARSAEVRGATWDEVDLDNQVWTIPAARMKGGREHRVPLSAAAISLLRGLYTEAGNPLLFIARGRGQMLSHSALCQALQRHGRTETAHGMRSAFSDWAHEQTAFSNHVIELSLAHSIGSAVEKSYRRSDLFDKRRQLMEAWGKFCSTNGIETAKVVGIGAAR